MQALNHISANPLTPPVDNQVAMDVTTSMTVPTSETDIPIVIGTSGTLSGQAATDTTTTGPGLEPSGGERVDTVQLLEGTRARRFTNKENRKVLTILPNN